MAMGAVTTEKKTKQVTQENQAVETPTLGEVLTTTEEKDIGVTAFTPQSVKEIVKHKYKLLQQGSPIPSLLLIGPPGVGKSTAIKEVAIEIARANGYTFIDITDRRRRDAVYNELAKCLEREKNEEACSRALKYFLFMDLRLTEVEPVDLVGYPYREEDRMDYAPPSWAYLLKVFPGILFLDELSNVKRADVLAAAYKILLDRKTGFVEFNKNTLVVSAGNLPKHAPGLTQSLPPPIINRCSVIYVSAPTIQEWYQWMKKVIDGMPPGLRENMLETLDLITSFLVNHEDAFINIVYDASKNENFPTPRSWSHFVFSYPMNVIKELAKNPPALRAIIASYLGWAVAGDLLPVLVHYQVIPFKEILVNPAVLDTILGKYVNDKSTLMDVLIALTIGLPTHLIKEASNKENVKTIYRKIYDYAKHLDPALGCSLLRSIAVAIDKLLITMKVPEDQKKIVFDTARLPIEDVSKQVGCAEKQPTPSDLARKIRETLGKK